MKSALFDAYRRRVVVPLVKASAAGKIFNPRFNATFTIRRTKVVLHPLEIASVATDSLGEPISSLAGEGDRRLGALDDLLTRAKG